ncbi:type I restriction-modification system subunit M [Maricaulis maris]|uniref:site-specific DNA-methyltransferase (adenine-specific) n=1 Tax=Maricaulis maris TaxID=74318 RepID=A0A495CXL7_9PROT|nr:class I SAM-dependent DNA methyltransferase [Maricaulis maris]RKQ89521.1 type I restriction enzyme M protein [Maricaulis maris]
MVDSEVASRLWAAANQLWANTGLRPSQFSSPVLGLIFLRYADTIYTAAEAELGPVGSGRGAATKVDYQAQGVIFLPPEARYGHLVALPEGADLGQALNDAMKAIEAENEDLAGALPRSFTEIPNQTLVELLRILAPVQLSGDAFGQVYEFFLGKLAMAEGQKGGVFYTPESLVDLIVEIVEPFHGRIFDPACGSGGMFVHSAQFVERAGKAASSEISVFGVEKDPVTVNFNKMNLAVHGLSGDVRVANSFYDRHQELFPRVAEAGGFDFVMANPPFNVKEVDLARLEKDARFPFGLPSTNNANYIWISLFHSALNETGRAGFVMANSAGDARGSEMEIRKKLIESGDVDVIVSVGPNMFLTVTLPCTLWFFDRAKSKGPRADQVLFIDARHTFRQIDRAHREFTPQQVEFLSNIVRQWRGEDLMLFRKSDAMLAEQGLLEGYADVPGLCKAASWAEIEAQGWSLNPGRYVGAAEGEDDEVEFAVRMAELFTEFGELNVSAVALAAEIENNLETVGCQK